MAAIGPTGQTRQLIDDFVNERYANLAELTHKNCRNSNRADDIVSYLTDRLYSGSEAVERVIMQGATAMEAWCKRIIYSSMRGHNDRMMAGSDIVSRKSISLEEMCENSLQEDSISESLARSGYVEEPKAFDFFFGTFFELELLRSGYDEEDVKRRLKLQRAINSLSPWQMELYRLYYEQRMTHREIAKLKKMPKTSAYKLLIELRERLNELLNTTVNTRYLY